MTDAEVLHELLHRYLAPRLWSGQGRQVFEYFAELMVQRVEPVHAEDVEKAASLVEQSRDVSARDLLHLAVMKRLGVRQIVSADADFDRWPDVERLDPTGMKVWRPQMWRV